MIGLGYGSYFNFQTVLPCIIHRDFMLNFKNSWDNVLYPKRFIVHKKDIYLLYLVYLVRNTHASIVIMLFWQVHPSVVLYIWQRPRLASVPLGHGE